jgi:hypothetical protein
MVTTPLGAMLALRWGARSVVAVGLGVVGLALLWGGVVSTHAAYVGPIVAIMVLLAFGFSLVNAPSTASLMGTLRPEQVGAGTAVNETTRELAGTLGVAVVGSVFSSFFGPGVRAALGRYVEHGLSTAQLHIAMSSTPAAQATVAHFPPVFRPVLSADVTNAFMSGLHHGCLVAGTIALLGAIVVFSKMPNARAEVEKELVLA